MNRADTLVLEQLSNTTPHAKICKKCTVEFPISQEDIDFYKKILIPVPQYCFECRLKRRLLFRNERHFYKRVCDISGKNILSIFSPDKKNIVYNHEYWESDKWEPLDFGQEYDPNRSFFEQWHELLLRTPVPSLMVLDNVNSEYTNHSLGCDSCYFTSVSVDNKYCMYSKNIWHSQYSIDCININKCEECYENISCTQNNSCFYTLNSSHCYNVYFSDNLKSCSNCIFSFNLQNKEYCIRNKQVTKSEFETFIKNLDWNKAKEEFLSMRNEQFFKYAHIESSEECTGDNIVNSKNCQYCFNADNSENCKYGVGITNLKDSYDCYGAQGELMYEYAGGAGSYYTLFSIIGNYNKYVWYTYFCSYSEYLFGCVSVKRKKYCILNKQYSKEEYFALVEQIKLDMLNRGEYGECFSEKCALFNYNESPANEYFPLTKEKAINEGFSWKSETNAPYSTINEYIPEKDISFYHNETHAKQLLGGILLCEVTGKPFKITPQELAFYIKHHIPIPRKCADQRHKERFLLTNPLKLWERRCMCNHKTHENHIETVCLNSFLTSSPPEAKYSLYCEECYQKEIF